MHVRFDLDFDGEVWPGPLQGRDAVAGEAWVGPQGLLRLLETALGLGGAWPRPAARLASAVRSLRACEGFWSRSFEADPPGVACTLLQWRDMLHLAGWEGQAIGMSRLDQLATVFAGVLPGLPDRVAAVARRLSDRGADVERIDVLASPSEIPLRWRLVLDRLRARGTRVCQWNLAAVNESPGSTPLAGRGLPQPLAGSPRTRGGVRFSAATEPLAAPAVVAAGRGGVRFSGATEPLAAPAVAAHTRGGGVRFSAATALLEAPAAVAASVPDLSRARAGRFTPAGDGSLQLVRPEGPLQAADEAAAWLAAQPSLLETVIVGADEVLDAALRRHGLPVTGAVVAARHDGLLALLPLVIMVSLEPCDPQQMLELLLLPSSPVPSSLARRLADALQQWPAVGSEAWDRVIDDHGAALERGDATAVEILLRPTVDRRQPYPVEEALRRIEQVEQWLRRTDGAGRALEQCRAVRDFLEQYGESEMPLSHLLEYAAQATESIGSFAPYPAQAGLRAVPVAGAVAGPARRVLWWNFSRDAEPPLPRLPFTRAELSVLAGIGVQLPDPAALAVTAAERWRRPFRQAQDALVLFCPRKGREGDEQFVHPLWDEVLCSLDAPGGRWRLECEVPTTGRAALRVQRVGRPLPSAKDELHVPSILLRPRSEESPSSLGSLVECSLRWAFRYVARLRPGRTAPLAGDNQLLGRIAHEVMAFVFGAGPISPGEAAERARAYLEQHVPHLAGALLLPGNERLRDDAGRVMIEAAADFAVLLAESGVEVRASECTLNAPCDGYVLEGRPDLLVEGPRGRAVVDFKWGGGVHHMQELRSGSAYQLAAYAWLARGAASDNGQIEQDAADPCVDGDRDVDGHQSADPTLAGVAYYVLRERRFIVSSRWPFNGGARVDGPSVDAMWRAFQAAVGVRLAELARGRLCASGLAEGGKAVQDARIEDGRLALSASCHFCDFARLCGRSGDAS